MAMPTPSAAAQQDNACADDPIQSPPKEDDKAFADESPVHVDSPTDGAARPLRRENTLRVQIPEKGASSSQLKERIARLRAEKELVEAECKRMRGSGGLAPPEGALTVPLPMKLLNLSKGPTIGTELTQTRSSLQKLVQKVDQLYDQRGHDLHRETSDRSPKYHTSYPRRFSRGENHYDINRDASASSDPSSPRARRGGLTRQVSPGGSRKMRPQRETSDGSVEDRRIARDSSEDIYGLRREESADTNAPARGAPFWTEVDTQARDEGNEEVLANSIAKKAPALQGAIYLLALGGVVFTLAYPAIYGEEHRRLGGAPAATSSSNDEDGHGIVVAISYATLAAGLMALLVSMLKQPLLLGYILAGFAVGPQALVLVEDHNDIATISGLGLVLLLFMIGLELDLHELLKMGKVVLLTGSFQFPICAGLHLGLFSLLSYAGISFGEGQHAVLYIACCTGISSTMIVVKLLSEKMETDTTAGRLTIGILIFQDIWAIVMLAIQPNMANPEITGLLKTFGFMAILILISFSYSKYVLPAVFMKASSSPELMLILALAWCFFICAVAILSFVGLSMELAALIAGVSMATFPYNAELNGKVKYIRDYFITLYFVALGMQIPMPTFEALSTALIVCIVVLLVRWIGIFSVAYMLGGGSRLAILSTVNLSEVSEFGLVLCSIGIKPDAQGNEPHILQDTMTINIWAFAILAIAASYFIGYNHSVLHFMLRRARKLPCSRCKQAGVDADGQDDEDDHTERDIIILGFHKIAAALISEFEHRAPQILRRVHVIDHKLSLAEPLAQKHVTFNYGDITSADVLEHARHGPVDLVLLTLPDYAIQGVNNLRLLEVAKQVWPNCHYIVIADDPKTTRELYKKGADYVVATKKLSAERISDMLADHYSDGLAGGELKHHLEQHRQEDGTWQADLIRVSNH